MKSTTERIGRAAHGNQGVLYVTHRVVAERGVRREATGATLGGEGSRGEPSQGQLVQSEALEEGRSGRSGRSCADMKARQLPGGSGQVSR